MYSLLLLNLIIPFVMIFVGFVLKKHPATDIKSGNGYSTPTSRKSQDHWDYAQSIAPDIFISFGKISGIVEVILSIVLFLLHISINTVLIVGVCVGFAFLFLAFYKTDSTIGKKVASNTMCDDGNNSNHSLCIKISAMVILLVGIIVWYNAPLNLMDLDPNEIMEIVVFNGNSGETTHVTDEQQIQHIIENLNDVKVKRSKPSVGYTGYSFKVTIYLSDGNEADGWNNFIINSADTIRKDPFFYSVVTGNIDYDYIEKIVK